MSSPSAAGADPAGSLPRVPDREELDGLEMEVVHPGSASKPSVSIAVFDGRRQVIKDARPLHPLLRAIYARRLLRREERALRWLAGAAGAPTYYGRVDEDAFSMEFRAGLPFRGRHASESPERFRLACLDLERKIDELHARGVVHLDLKQRRNILVDESGAVSLLDFESALLLGTTGLGGWLRDRFAWLDRVASLKFKAKFASDLMTDEERARLRRAQGWASLWVFHHLGAGLRWLLGGRSGDTRD